MTVYGYARVSSDGQSLTAQDAELHRAGAAKVYKETISGAASNRPQLQKLLRVISEGDVGLVTSTTSPSLMTRSSFASCGGWLPRRRSSLCKPLPRRPGAARRPGRQGSGCRKKHGHSRKLSFVLFLCGSKS